MLKATKVFEFRLRYRQLVEINNDLLGGRTEGGPLVEVQEGK